MLQSTSTTHPPEPIPENVIFPSGAFFSDEPPLETDLHREQIDLLIRLLKWWWRQRQDVYISGNLTIFSVLTRKSQKTSEAQISLWYWVLSRRTTGVGWCGKKRANTPM